MNTRLNRYPQPNSRRSSRRENGAALLLTLLVLTLFSLGLLLQDLRHAQLSQHHARLHLDQLTLHHAREALLGSAVSYRDTHANEVHGYLRCPELSGNKGESASPCGSRDVSSLGRLPWKTLGLPVLRDHAGECLWYVVAGRAKNNPKTTLLNWDTPGQFVLRDESDNILAGSNPHDQPWAVIFSAGFAIDQQSRAADADSAAGECGGSKLASAYLESIDGDGASLGSAQAITTIRLTATQDNNDRAVWLNSHDIFQRVMRRQDFAQDIERLLNDLAACLGNWPADSLPTTSATYKGLQDAVTRCPAASLNLDNNFRAHWEEQLLYTRPPSAAQVQFIEQTQMPAQTQTHCAAVLLFGGQRTAGQSRLDNNEKNDPAMYLEDDNAHLFPASGLYHGSYHFDANHPSRDLLRCIRALPPQIQQISLAGHMDEFQAIGDTVSKKKVDAATPPTDTGVPILSGKSQVIFSPASPAFPAESGASCLWYPQPLPLAGKRWRMYHSFRFDYSDTYATASNQRGFDRGKGYTLQLLRGDLGAPEHCGSLHNMGALDANDAHGAISILIETDVHADSAHNDPNGNHSAILLNGNLRHEQALGNDCNGQVSGCRHTPASTFEDTPMAMHNQRVEIHTNCTADCSHCPSGEPAGVQTEDAGTHALIKVWIDCQDCMSIQSDLPAERTPSLSRCIVLPPELHTSYFGFTGGFLSAAALEPAKAAPEQGVALGNFYLGIE